MNADEKAEAAREEEMRSVLKPEIHYHYNAMASMMGMSQPGITLDITNMCIQSSIAWSLMGLLRAQIREAQ